MTLWKKIVFFAGSVAVLATAAYSLIHGSGKWSIPVWVYGAVVFFAVAWQYLRERNTIRCLAMAMVALVNVALVIAELTGIQWPVMATGVPAGIMGIVFLWDMDRKGWKIRQS